MSITSSLSALSSQSHGILILIGDFLRYYAWDYRVLRKFARHYSTGEVIPEKLVESMQGARKMFAATDLQRQVYSWALNELANNLFS